LECFDFESKIIIIKQRRTPTITRERCGRILTPNIETTFIIFNRKKKQRKKFE
jgi:hypothetical protein